jgi:protein SCO1
MKNVSQIDRWMVFLILPLSLIVVQGCQNSRNDAAAAVDQPSEATTIHSTPTALEENVKTELDCCKTEMPAKPAALSEPPKVEVVAGGVTIPDVTLINQDGQPVNVARDLGQDKLLVINFIFTTCKGVCPPMGVNFGQLQSRLAGRIGKEVNLVSVSVDPVTDTPERLKTWAQKFGASTGWTLLTGQKQDVDHFLKALGVFAANKTEHSPFIMVGRVSDGRWKRIHGLTPNYELSEVILGSLASPVTHQPASSQDSQRHEGTGVSAAQNYFTDVLLVDQDGRKLRLYSDILKGKVVVITPFFTTCRGSCPHLLDTFAKLQSHYEDRLGKDLYLLSLTVDPDLDTPDKLKAHAEQYHALPGWYFLTGDKTNLYTALAKLGHRVQAKEDHSNVFIIGNDSTGLWKKAMGLAPAAEIIRIVETVLNDKPS